MSNSSVHQGNSTISRPIILRDILLLIWVLGLGWYVPLMAHDPPLCNLNIFLHLIYKSLNVDVHNLCRCLWPYNALQYDTLHFLHCNNFFLNFCTITQSTAIGRRGVFLVSLSVSISEPFCFSSLLMISLSTLTILLSLHNSSNSSV